MTLSEQKLAQAKQEAKELLEYSINCICITLNVDVSTIGESYEHDFEVSDPEYAAHESLKRQVENYLLISGS